MDEVVSIFSSIGYEVAYGPEAETSWHNFDALNTPEWHPARYESDTLYLDKNLDTLLRTQTSTVQIRHMEENDPPVFIAADKDNIDALKLENCLEKVRKDQDEQNERKLMKFFY